MADLEESTTAATEKVKEAEEKEASVADEEESTTAVALMAIGEATSSSSEGMGNESSDKDESSSKANSTSSEEFVTASEDGSVNSCPEGVVSEELLTEQKVKKNIITNGDNCILTESDIIETNDKLKTLVHKPTPLSHNAELSKARSNEPYRRTYVDKRNCFHYGLVGHLFMNYPSKNLGKRHVVSQQAVIPKSPPVTPPKCPKQNVVKPPVKPMVKPKIKSEAKPSISRKVTQPVVPCVYTSGSTRTGEASTSSPAVVESKSPVPVKKHKRSWTAKSKNSQSPSSNSFKDSSILNSHHDCELKEETWPCFKTLNHSEAAMWPLPEKKGGSITCQGVVSNGCVSFDTVNFCEQLKHNLLSVSQMCDEEYSVMFDKSECLILKPGFEVPEDWILMRAPRTNDTYQIDMSVATTTSSVATCLLTKATELDSILWHRKLGHISYRKMNHLVRNGLVTGIPKLRFTVADDSMPCKKGKQQWKSHKPKLQNSIDTPLELLHMDLFGPISIRSIGGKSFCLVIIDDFSRFSWVHFLGTKDETADILQYLILSLESLCKLKVRRIRSDNGTEFKNNLMELFCLKKGICHEFSAPYMPQQNGVAERKNRTLIETARTMLSDAKLPVIFWVEAVNTACHVLNRVLVVKRHNKTCYELINNRLPNLDYLVPFGSPCSLLLQYKDRQSKFHTKAVEGIFLGYIANSPCKRVYNIGTRTVEEWFEVDCSKHSIPPEPTGPDWGFDYDALFKSFNLPDLSTVDAVNVYELLGGDNDSSFSTRATVPIVTPDSNAASASGTHDSDNSEDVLIFGDDGPPNPNTTVGNEAPADLINIESSSSGTQEMGELSTNLDPEIQEPIVPETRVHRNHSIDNIIGDPYAGVQTRHRTITENTSLYSEKLDTGVMETCLHAAFVSQLEPKNVKEALTDNFWIEAMQDELSEFQKLHVWDLVDLPKGFQPIGTRWVFKCKTDDRHVKYMPQLLELKPFDCSWLMPHMLASRSINLK
ncbi:hypothetical protein L1987_48538 [Smallanthus sonchifolius]|uniref:Uncharacterized protein n=1 Tax=Smallanthus sonchifolius TaxID=185202 RepID=A0ACB9FTV5_9ASTR|nr:hypothetical protein L1987_48538 [Smallanthus sonchifolius]